MLSRCALRSKPSSSFQDLLKQTLQWEKRTKPDQSCPYAEIVKAVRGKQAHLTQPLFNVCFSMEDSADKGCLKIAAKTLIVDLSLTVFKKEGQIRLRFEFSASLQDRSFIERMAKNFQVFLKEGITYPKKKSPLWSC